MFEKGNLTIYTADDEEPSCNSCDLVYKPCEWCEKHCGTENGWNGYIRTARCD